MANYVATQSLDYLLESEPFPLQRLSPDQLFTEFYVRQCGLIEMVQPLVMLLAHALTKETPEDYEQVARRYLRAFVRQAPVLAGLLDHKLNFVAQSNLWEKWTSRHFKHTDTHDNFLKQFPNCPLQIRNALKAAHRGESRRYDLIPWMVSNKKMRWLRWESFPWFDKQHEPQGVMFFCKDITDQHNTVIYNQNLQQSNEMLQNFSAIFSHDLLQPIRQVSNFSALLKDHLKTKTGDDPFINHAFKAINQSLEQVYRLSEGIAMYCRNGNLAVEQQDVRLKDALTQIQASCLSEPQFEFVNTITEDVILYINPVCLLQLFQNLLSNALKYAPPYQRTITLSGKPLGNDFYQFSLHNHGYCTSRNLRKYIFEPFQSSQIDGAGLGLMICKRIVTAYGGKISFMSSPKKGTRVVFTLPTSKVSSS